MSGIPLIQRAPDHAGRPAVDAPEGLFTYRQLLDASARCAGALLGGRDDLAGARVAFLVPPGFAWVLTWWGIWRAGGIAVPLCLSHPRPELEYVVTDSGASILVAHPELAGPLRPIVEERGARLLLTPELVTGPAAELPRVGADRRAMIVYTSGTTGRAKGVVTTHANLEAQMRSLVEAWGWSAEDRILLALPLHHVHGIVNVLGCALWSGALCEMLPAFDAGEVWRRFGRGDLTLFMAVPTIYSKLISAWEGEPADRRRRWADGAARMRLMVSGSAALPVPLLERWREITGHTLLERYGMTEFGMALSNPLRGERRPGRVGSPLPGVEVRRVDERGGPAPPRTPAEIQVRGAGVFREYWGRPEETAEAFDPDGWFRTGDVAVEEEGSYRILGRQSVDILKTGGYKVSALEIEEALLRHPAIAECAVVGPPDPEWGQRVAAAVVLAGDRELTLEELRGWARQRLAPYKIPSRLLFVEELPRNPLGKVTKPAVLELFESDG